MLRLRPAFGVSLPVESKPQVRIQEHNRTIPLPFTIINIRQLAISIQIEPLVLLHDNKQMTLGCFKVLANEIQLTQSQMCRSIIRMLIGDFQKQSLRLLRLALGKQIPRFLEILIRPALSRKTITCPNGKKQNEKT